MKHYKNVLNFPWFHTLYCRLFWPIRISSSCVIWKIRWSYGIKNTEIFNVWKFQPLYFIEALLFNWTAYASRHRLQHYPVFNVLFSNWKRTTFFYFSFNVPNSRSNMAIMDIGAVSGFEPQKDMVVKSPLMKRIELLANRLIIYFDEVKWTYLSDLISKHITYILQSFTNKYWHFCINSITMKLSWSYGNKMCTLLTGNMWIPVPVLFVTLQYP